MISIPSLYDGVVVGISNGKYLITLNGQNTNVPFGFAYLSLEAGQRIVVVNSDRMRIFRPEDRSDTDNYPIIGELLSGIRYFRGGVQTEGLILFDPDFDGKNVIAIAKNAERLGNLELTIGSLGGSAFEKQETYQGANSLHGGYYRSAESISNKVKDPSLYQQVLSVAQFGASETMWSVVIPARWLSEKSGDSSRLKPGMLEYCVEHAKLPRN